MTDSVPLLSTQFDSFRQEVAALLSLLKEEPRPESTSRAEWVIKYNERIAALDKLVKEVPAVNTQRQKALHDLTVKFGEAYNTCVYGISRVQNSLGPCGSSHYSDQKVPAGIHAMNELAAAAGTLQTLSRALFNELVKQK